MAAGGERVPAAGTWPGGPEAAAPSERPSYRSAAFVGVFTLLSRVTGVLREATRAHFLGAGPIADAFHVALLLPNLFRRLVGEGAVSSALVPVFSRVAHRGEPAEEKVFAEKFLTLWLVLVLAVTAAGVLLGGRFVALAFQWGSFAELSKTQLTGELTSLLFWYLLFVGMAAALQGLLNARGQFAIPSASPLVFNLAFVACAWAAAPWYGDTEAQAFVLAGAVLAGGVFQLVLMVPLVWRLGVRPRVRWPLDHGEVRQVLRLFLPAVFGAGIYQVNVLVSTVLAGRLEDTGSVAVLGYSNRLMEVVLGIYVFALSTVSLTSLSRQAADGDFRGYADTLGEVLRLVVFITIPSTVGLYLLREPALSLLLESGAFDQRSLEMTARAFQFHVLGLAFVGVTRVLVNGFYALRDVATPVRIAAVNLVFHLGLAWMLSAGQLAFAGIALASSIAAALQAALLWRMLDAKVSGLDLRGIGEAVWKTAAASAVMGALVWGGRRFLDLGAGKPLLAAELALLILTAAGVFFIAGRLLGLPEASRWIDRVLRRPRR